MKKKKINFTEKQSASEHKVAVKFHFLQLEL